MENVDTHEYYTIDYRMIAFSSQWLTWNILRGRSPGVASATIETSASLS